MIIMMGLAGSGKGTQTQMLVEEDNYSLISTGDLLRHHASPQQKQKMLAGILLSDEDIYQLINKAMEGVPDLKKCLMEGTPRSIPQAEWLMEQVRDGRFSVEAVIHLEVAEEVVRQRLRKRGRADDTEAGITKRFEEYHRATLPIISYFKDQHIPVYSVNASQSPEAVHRDIIQALKTA